MERPIVVQKKAIYKGEKYTVNVLQCSCGEELMASPRMTFLASKGTYSIENPYGIYTKVEVACFAGHKLKLFI